VVVSFIKLKKDKSCNMQFEADKFVFLVIILLCSRSFIYLFKYVSQDNVFNQI